MVQSAQDALILHQFPASPFAEKIRLVLGLKGLAWRAVELPMVMPKPQLVALTGGYRKTPVLQIGADVYCDTQRIAAELERRFPTPSLFPSGSAGLCRALGAWSDILFFQPGAALSMGTNPDLPEVVLEDRKKFFSFLDFSTLEARIPHFYSQFHSHLHTVNRMLEERGPFVLGEQAAWADVLAYFPIWMARNNIRDSAELIAPFAALLSWEVRMQALGHGHPEPMAADAALDIAAAATSACSPCIAPDAWPRGLSEGEPVSVAAQDYGADPVQGSLLRLSAEEIALRRSDPRLGDLVVHFPRVGFEVIPQS